MKMAKTNKLFILAFALSLLTACDYVSQKQDLMSEREDSTYRAALADYHAGRLDAAARGFAKAIKKNPANSAARFQYACLMQDSKKDYLEAYFSYREYLLQHPESDKAKIARDRLALCEREMAKELAEKHRLIGDDASAKEIEVLKKSLKETEDRAASAEKQLASEREKYRALSSEHDRLVAAVKDTGADESAKPRSEVSVKDLLDEEDEETSSASFSSDVAKLKAEEAEEASSGTSLLPKQTAEDRARRDAAEKAKEAAERAAAEKAAAEKAKRPPVYVVQEGDTLYKIALRFYGRVSAWRLIREANKVTIPPDGRVKTGQSIKLP